MDQNIRHMFEDADTGDEMQPETGVTYSVIQTLLDIDNELVFTHRLREAGFPDPVSVVGS